jgi:phage terminase large subunit GpA-like protein
MAAAARRNEALDCRVYAAWIAGAHRWTEGMWCDLEQQVGAPEPREHDLHAEPNAVSANIAGVIRRRPGKATEPTGVSVELYELMTDGTTAMQYVAM